MNIQQVLLAEYGLKPATIIANYCIENADGLAELIQLFLGTDDRISQRAAYPMFIIGNKNPEILQPLLPNFIAHLQKPNVQEAVIRNIVRFLQDWPIPEALEGQVLDLCFKFLTDPKQPAATKAFSISVIEKMVKKYPELLPEFIYVLETALPYEKPSYKARARKAIKRLSNITFE